MAGGLNSYEYVENNPVNLIDPEGLKGFTPSASRRGSAQRPFFQGLTNFNVRNLLRRIKQIDPAFPGFVQSRGGSLTQQNVRDLQQSLNNAQNAGFCGPGAALPRPKNVPEDWIIRPSKIGGGKRFIDPTNTHNSVRVMPGEPNSPFPNSREPYVRWQRGQPLDVNGRPVSQYTPEAHIPLGEFTYIP